MHFHVPGNFLSRDIKILKILTLDMEEREVQGEGLLVRGQN